MTKIAAVCTAYHEADILPWTVEHLLAEGIDHIWIECPFGDRETAHSLERFTLTGTVTVNHYVELYHDQPTSIKRMGNLAHDWFAHPALRNTEQPLEDLWILPFDADEFWYQAGEQETVGDRFRALGEDIGVVTAVMLQQRDWYYRDLTPKPLPKVAYRWNPDITLKPGNHGIENYDGIRTQGGFFIREIQYRSFEHFCRKVEERNATLDPNADATQGIHHTRLKGASESKLAQEWERMMEVPHVWDPIPSKITPPTHLAPYPELLPMDKLFAKMLEEPSDMQGHMERLRDLAKNKRVLECGTNTGQSTVAFLAGEPVSLESIDILPVRVRPECRASDRWTLTICDDIAPSLLESFEGRFWDVIFLDTSHTLRQTVLELEAYEPHLVSGGCFVLHDTESYPEVALAIQHYIHVLKKKGREPTKIEKYHYSMGLQILWLP